MHAETQPVSVAEREAFHSMSRLLFGPIVQQFPPGAEPRAPRLVSLPLGVCRLSKIRAGAHFVVNDRALWRSFDPDAIKILMQLRGASCFEQRSTVIDLSPGSVVIYDPVRRYSLRNVSAVDQLILQVPRSTFDDETLARLATPAPLSARDDSLTRIVSGLMRMAISDARTLDEASRRRVGESLIQLVAGLIRARRVAPEPRRAPLETLRDRVVAHIDANLAGAGLTCETIARRMGCSRRYLHRAFEGENATLERLIWARRLERSRQLLTPPSPSSTSISEIAFACGFNSSAHFSRAFKDRYDVAPRAFRDRQSSPAH